MDGPETGLLSNAWPLRLGLSKDFSSVFLVWAHVVVTLDCVASRTGRRPRCKGLEGVVELACTGLAGRDLAHCVAVCEVGNGLHGAERGLSEAGLLPV